MQLLAKRTFTIALLLFGCTAHAGERAILVLGSAVQANGKPTPGLARRLQLARKLATTDPDAVIVVSGGTRGGKWKAEGPVMARWLTSHGVSPSRIRVEDRATNTAENADYARPILLAEGVHRVTVARAARNQPVAEARGVARLATRRKT